MCHWHRCLRLCPVQSWLLLLSAIRFTEIPSWQTPKGPKLRSQTYFQSKHMSNSSFKNFTGYQSAQESSTKFQLCALTPSPKLVLSVSLNSWLSTTRQDNSALRQIREPFQFLSRKQKPSENDLFLSKAPDSGNHYRMMFVVCHLHLLSRKR